MIFKDEIKITKQFLFMPNIKKRITGNENNNTVYLTYMKKNL